MGRMGKILLTKAAILCCPIHHMTMFQNKNYPELLVTSGLNDPRVQYWEPTKWVAKLRMKRQMTIFFC